MPGSMHGRSVFAIVLCFAACCGVAGDTLGNIALLDIDGGEIWERHVKSMIGQVSEVQQATEAQDLKVVCPTAGWRASPWQQAAVLVDVPLPVATGT